MSVQSESYLNKTDSHCGPKVLSLQSIKPCCGKNQKWTAHSELAGNLRRTGGDTGGDTGEGVEGGSDPDPAETHTWLPEPEV